MKSWIIYIVVIALIYSLSLKTNFFAIESEHFTNNQTQIKAVAVLMPNNSNVGGYVQFEEKDDITKIKVYASGFKPYSIHGIHIHSSGDLRFGCDSLCEHYNPYNKKHGGPNDKERHVGDLGNLTADHNGIVQKVFFDDQIKLCGQYSIIGRSVVLHADSDDYGKGGFHDSLTTGHSGKRIACGVIGYEKSCV